MNRIDPDKAVATVQLTIPSNAAATVMPWLIIAAAVAAGLYFLLWTIARRYAQAQAHRPEDNEQRRRRGLPVDHCIGEKRNGAGNETRGTVLTIYTDRTPDRIEGLTTAEAEKARDWWLDPYTRATPGSALWILEGPLELPNGEQTWRTQLVSDAASIQHMLIETDSGEGGKPTENSETPMPKGWQPDPHDDR